ncbi:lipid asymmetry maintenance protein MlaB [Chitinimonas sp.]|uniref:STAS domain-containing protein n=1 Tax=Chitinimonas sp. TaxID=1934313 RepID=UPI0035B3BE83
MATTISLAGSLTLESISRVEREVAPSLTQDQVILDLSAINEIDSAAISLLLHWQRAAMAAGHRLFLRNPPASLLSLAGLYGVEEFLPLESA